MGISSRNSKHNLSKKDLQLLRRINLSKREIKNLLSLFNRINIYNIENDNTIWSPLLSVLEDKQSQKILNAKKKFIAFCLVTESKLRKIIRLQNNESSYSTKEHLLVNGLVYLELLKYDESQDFNWEDLNFNKTTLKEYWEAKKFISNSFKNIKKNIENELLKLFKKISAYKRKEIESFSLGISAENFSPLNKRSKLPDSLRSVSPPNRSKGMSVDNHLYLFDDPEEMGKNFEEYLKWRKFQVLEELAIFQQETEEDSQAKKVFIEEFIEDEVFQAFIRKIKKKNEDFPINEIEEEELIIEKTLEAIEVKEIKKKNLQKEIEMSCFPLKFEDESRMVLIGEENIKRFRENEKSFNEKMEVFNSKLEKKIKKISIAEDSKNSSFKNRQELKENENKNIMMMVRGEGENKSKIKTKTIKAKEDEGSNSEDEEGIVNDEGLLDDIINEASSEDEEF